MKITYLGCEDNYQFAITDDGLVRFRKFQPGVVGRANGWKMPPMKDLHSLGVLDLPVLKTFQDTMRPMEVTYYEDKGRIHSDVTKRLANRAHALPESATGRTVRELIDLITTPKAAPTQVAPPSDTDTPLPSGEVTSLDEIPDRLRAFIPRKEDCRWHKRGWNNVDEFLIAARARRMRRNMLVEGPTGTGKTHYARILAYMFQVPLVIISGSASADSDQLFGYTDLADGTTVFTEGLLTDIMQHPSVVAFDEMNLFRQEILGPLYPVLDSERAIRVAAAGGSRQIRVHEKCLIIATQNPDYEGTMQNNFALRRRFQETTYWGYDERVERKLTNSKHLVDIAGKLRHSKDIYTDIATPSLVEFAENARDVILGPDALDYATATFVQRFLSQEEKTSVEDVFRINRQNLLEDFPPPVEGHKEARAEVLSDFVFKKGA